MVAFPCEPLHLFEGSALWYSGRTGGEGSGSGGIVEKRDEGGNGVVGRVNINCSINLRLRCCCDA